MPIAASTKGVIRIAAHYVTVLQARRDAYRDACDADATAGYRPHYCEHGMNLWVDYDPICGFCEEGHHLDDPLFLRAEALRQAHDYVDAAMAVVRHWVGLEKLGLNDPFDLEAALDTIGRRYNAPARLRNGV